MTQELLYITDNEGQTIPVEADFYQELQACYDAGDWATIITYGEGRHVIILPDNFN